MEPRCALAGWLGHAGYRRVGFFTGSQSRAQTFSTFKAVSRRRMPVCRQAAKDGGDDEHRSQNRNDFRSETEAPCERCESDAYAGQELQSISVSQHEICITKLSALTQLFDS